MPMMGMDEKQGLLPRSVTCTEMQGRNNQSRKMFLQQPYLHLHNIKELLLRLRCHPRFFDVMPTQMSGINSAMNSGLTTNCEDLPVLQKVSSLGIKSTGLREAFIHDMPRQTVMEKVKNSPAAAATAKSTKHHHKWVAPSCCRHISVNVGGSRDFVSVQAAVDFVPENNTESTFIYISPGLYIEKVVVPASKPYITFQGAGKKVTVIEWHDRASDRGPDGQQLRTYRTASVTVFANYFSGRNISFKNTAPAPVPGMQGWQAAAFRISGDKAYFKGCGFYGAQDTLCDDAGRHYFKDCYIEGSIDFIFGNGRSMYKDCKIHSIATGFGSIAAQDRRDPEEKTGFAFMNCSVTGTGPLYIGRAMGKYSRIVYSYTYFDDLVAPGGWDDWDHASGKNKTVFFGVYKCWGPGADAVRGVSWAKELDYNSAHPFIAKSFVNGRHWIAPSDA